ncbi:MAG TPA: hypothetical protein VML55_12345 [Planctomycetaceae bacterium]|nr:hypothetical protein [Planctomycetaceae bacterium]
MRPCCTSRELHPDDYVNVRLEEIYQRAWHGVPERWKRAITHP